MNCCANISTMLVKICEPIGFCAGVELAMKKALDLAKSGKKVAVLGMLVHNQDAINELSNNGVITIYSKDKNIYDLISEIPQGYTVVLTAHGHELRIETKLKELGFDFIDATCPKVLLAESKIKYALKLNHEIIFIGKKNHPEANAMLSISNKIHLFELNGVFDYSNITDPNPIVISQTTFSKDEISKTVGLIKENIPNVQIIDNVCNASLLRQNAIKDIPNDADAIFVVGGSNSNNTKTLYSLAVSTHQNSKVFLIENKDQVNKKDLLGLNCAYIVSGASTPKNIIIELKQFLETI